MELHSRIQTTEVNRCYKMCEQIDSFVIGSLFLILILESFDCFEFPCTHRFETSATRCYVNRSTEKTILIWIHTFMVYWKGLNTFFIDKRILLHELFCESIFELFQFNQDMTE